MTKKALERPNILADWDPTGESNLKLSIKSNSGLLCFRFTSLYDWSWKLVPLCQPIRGDTKTNHDLVARVFPRFSGLIISTLPSHWFFKVISDSFGFSFPMINRKGLCMLS